MITMITSLRQGVLYLSGSIVSEDELEVMAPADGFPLLRRQEELGSSLPTLQAFCCVLLDLKRQCKLKSCLNLLLV